MKQIYLLLVCQGFYLGSVCQRWTFPSSITALIGSCVEIPCIYHPAGSSGASSTVWYLFTIYNTNPLILNTKDPSSVRINYKERTSLVPGDNSCSLRIDPVRGKDGDNYYPGIAEDGRINAFNKNLRTVIVAVTDKLNIQLHAFTHMTEGNATIIRCAANHTCRSSPPTLQWNQLVQAKNRSVEISAGTWRKESEFIYIPLYEDDGILVQCTATFPNGLKREISKTLNINYAPKNVTVSMFWMGEMMEGSNVTLQCNSSSKPNVYDYEWFKGKDKTKLPQTGWEITVKNVNRETEPYSCTAINDVGRGESALMEIPVLYEATGVHVTVKNEGEFIKLICDFQSSRPDVTHYTWMKDGSILQNETGKTLTIEHNEKRYGWYSCIAHNSVGNSSSQEMDYKGGTSHLPLYLIVGSVAAVFLLTFLILIIYFCLRKKRKPDPPASSIHGTSIRIPYENNMDRNDNQYEQIQSNHQTKSSSIRSEPSINVDFEDNHVIYSNSDVIQAANEVEYSVISHEQHNQTRQNSSAARQQNVVEYATLKL